ncbi:proton-dependent oligopeptide transporter, POT family [Amycolatopsis arida]|uniref:Proton-dependent oligopeptide transporter, POT family n=1 Tax=Amycolatopsis arida TaxID=587909 RepID=A0A1I6AYX7_9PSEU|nr:oligopeptide:H+ symporter [Amycolatopsis arida]TDX83914.1 POT family proton-dependent oligopeptide transporter [Amycolatopsis arida]SFQ73866.1 proton-dependent oligopeptide transporter, POT family [Amycolatopsis arida]
MSTSTEVKRDTGFFGHPRALGNLFGVEMWERFSFYGMQAILIYYLYYSTADGGLALPEGTATSIVGAYGGLVYLSTIVGAWIADRVIGSERVLFYSAILIMFGHISLALLPGFVGVGVGLGCIALGSGGLKANATSLVGTLYSEHDERRDGGFTIFYMGVNIGALLGPILTGLAHTNLGFHYGFGLAAIGMALGLIQYSFGRKNLGGEVNVVPNPLPAALRPLVVGGVVAVVAVIVVLVLTGVITAANLSDITVVVVLAAAIGYFAVILSSKGITTVERRRVFSFIPMFIASFAFFSLFQQQFTVVPIYFAERVDRTIGGWQMPEAWVNSINPVFIILLATVFAALWTKLGSRQPSTPIKFAMGTAAMGASFLLFLPITGGEPNSAPLFMIVVILLGFTVAELMLSPVGLSLSTKLAPKRFRTQMVALNFLSIALGTAMAGSLAQYYSVDDEATYFGTVGGVAVLLGLALAAASPFIRKLMSGVR